MADQWLQIGQVYEVIPGPEEDKPLEAEIIKAVGWDTLAPGAQIKRNQLIQEPRDDRELTMWRDGNTSDAMCVFLSTFETLQDAYPMPYF